jgi:hypothetical protein
MRGRVYGVRETATNTIVYVGSSEQRLFCMRKGDHTKPSVKSRPIHVYVAENGGWDAFEFECLEEGEFETTQALRMREQDWIDKLTPSQNHQRAYRSHEDYLADKRTQQAAFRATHPNYHRRYAGRVTPSVMARCSTKIACPCGGTYSLQNKSNHFSRQIHKAYEAHSHQVAEPL